MRYRNFYLIFIELSFVVMLGIISTSSFAASSNTRYVTDELAIMMRSGTSNQHRIIQSLDSGTELRVLKHGKDYTQVKTNDGKTGWVLSRYLVKSPVARTVLPPLKKQLETLEAKNRELTDRLQETTRERDELKKIAAKYELLESKHNELTAEAIELRQMVAKSSGLFETNETLSRKTKTLNAQVDVLISEIKELSEGNDKLWFLTGSGVILVGFLAGAMLSRSRKPKQSSWASASDTLMLRQPSING